MTGAGSGNKPDLAAISPTHNQTMTRAICSSTTISPGTQVRELAPISIPETRLLIKRARRQSDLNSFHFCDRTAPSANGWIGKPNDCCDLQDNDERKCGPISHWRIVSAVTGPEIHHKTGHALQKERTRNVAGAEHSVGLANHVRREERRKNRIS